MRFIHPYLAFITYRFHVEKSREIGIRIEDFYLHKFHKEPYFMHHIYAQYFHPETLLERVRDVNFYRRTRTLYKGFKVPEWATSEKTSGYQFDAYSREAWDNAIMISMLRLLHSHSLVKDKSQILSSGSVLSNSEKELPQDFSTTRFRSHCGSDTRDISLT
jgi:hypothetical protein